MNTLVFFGANSDDLDSADEYIKLVMDFATGDSVDMSLVVSNNNINDGHRLNQSRCDEF